MKRHYYAAYSPYGIRAVYNEYNAPTIYTFDTERERDAYVAHRQRLEGFELKTEAITSDVYNRIKKYQNDDPLSRYVADHVGISTDSDARKFFNDHFSFFSVF